MGLKYGVNNGVKVWGEIVKSLGGIVGLKYRGNSGVKLWEE